jgi:hypothetical protein
VAGAAQGDRAARRQGSPLIQPGSGDICRILPEPLQSRRSVLRSGGDRRICSRHVRATLARERSDALFVAGDAFFTSRRGQLVTLTTCDRIPAAYAQSGGARRKWWRQCVAVYGLWNRRVAATS